MNFLIFLTIILIITCLLKIIVNLQILSKKIDSELIKLYQEMLNIYNKHSEIKSRLEKLNNDTKIKRKSVPQKTGDELEIDESKIDENDLPQIKDFL